MYRIDKDKVFWRQVDGETVVLNMDTGFYYTLDEIGGLIWERVSQNHSVEEMTREILDHYDADRSEVCRDIENVLQDLQNESLIEVP